MAEARVTSATGGDGLRQVTIALPPGLPVLSLNGRLHWAARNKAAQALKQAAWAIVAGAKVPPMERAVITVEYQPPDKRRRDPDNYAATGKPLIDGLVAAGVLPDDDGKHVAAVRYVIGPLYPLHPRGRIILRVREVREAPAMAGDDSISGD
jgi:crossover junction endodeoxyribonuclease RusA